MRINYHGVIYQWRFSKFLIHGLIIVSVLTIMISYISNVAKADLPQQEMIIVVHHGDTLWSLAKKIKPHDDPRWVIRNIKEQNHLDSSELMAGQKLKLVMEHE